MQQAIMIPTDEAASMAGLSERAMRKRIAEGTVKAVIRDKRRDGKRGKSYVIPLEEIFSAMTIDEKIRYYEKAEHPDVPMDFDLSEYRMRFKTQAEADDAINELFRRQQACIALIGTRRMCAGSLAAQVDQIAEHYQVSTRGLYRWEDAYIESGISGLMRKKRADAGKSRTMCEAAKRFINEAYLTCGNENGRMAQAVVFEEVCAYAEQHRDAAFCAHCPNCPGSEERDQIALMDEEDGAQPISFYPLCTMVGNGVIGPDNRHAVNRYIDTIPPEIVTYYRRGRMAWKKDHMTKALRTKPTMVNECWFGDHHQIDIFCLNSRGKAVRPWITVFYDAASGRLVHATMSENPNSETIMDTFARGAVRKPGSDICGLPKTLYIDNGKDYRSSRFEGDPSGAYDPNNEIGRADLDITNQNILKVFRVEVIHAKAYHAWAKPVERYFRTLEEHYLRAKPGWCGNSPSTRPEHLAQEIEKMAKQGVLLTLDELYDHLINDIFPAYDNRPHAGYGGKKPAELYASLPKARPEVPEWRTVSAFMTESKEHKVTAQGIRHMNRLYWAPELMHMSGEWVLVRYCRDDLASVTVYTMRSEWICEAPIKETMRMVGEDEETIAAHVAMQHRQERELLATAKYMGARKPGKRASGSVYYGEVCEDAPPENMPLSLQSERAARGKRAVKAELAERRRREKDASGAVGQLFLANAERLLKSK